MWHHFFPLLFPKDSESLKILDIRLREVGAKRPLNGTSKPRSLSGLWTNFISYKSLSSNYHHRKYKWNPYKSARPIGAELTFPAKCSNCRSTRKHRSPRPSRIWSETSRAPPSMMWRRHHQMHTNLLETVPVLLPQRTAPQLRARVPLKVLHQ